MQLFSIAGNTQKLDGGAMFGNCPRVVWERWFPPDAEHRIDLACRALLVREATGRHVLLEAGIGAFFEPKLRARYGVTESRHVLIESLAEVGVTPNDIDVVVLSHLHFDHAGGILTPWEEGKPAELVFPRARYVVGDRAWQRAKLPHARDRASFIPRITELLETSGRLELVEEGASSPQLGASYTFTFSDGHTPGLMLARVEGAARGPVTFMGDLVPGIAWVHLPITMGYDRSPELLIDEKRALLAQIAAQNESVFFTHDPKVAAARIQIASDGRFRSIDEVATLP